MKAIEEISQEKEVEEITSTSKFYKQMLEELDDDINCAINPEYYLPDTTEENNPSTQIEEL